MIQVSDEVAIHEDTIELRSIYASGPGGQHVNKNRTAIQLRFHIVHAHSLPHEVCQRLIRLAGDRVNGDCQLVITARNHRSQERNRREAYERLFALIRKAAEVPKVRVRKRRSPLAQQERLDEKRKRSETKRMRQPVLG